MSYIGISPSTAAFPFDQFSGNGTTTAFTMSYAPASTTSMVVCISGVVQNPNTYGISGLTLTFSAAPPTGTNNIAVLYLGIPATSVTTPGNTAFFSSTSFTATAGQTTFTPSGTYQVGFINVIRNGSQLAPADYTATNGTTVVLANACVAGDIVVIEVYNLTSLTNALPSTGGTVTGATTFNSTVSINGANGSGYTGYKNRIINGGMVIDQRNNGAAVTVNVASSIYGVDRFFGWGQPSAGVFTIQQSTVAPTGFKNSTKITVTTADASLGAVKVYAFAQAIEGFNTADLSWGTASAATITLSFWVQSSIAGTYSATLFNNAYSRGYTGVFTINSANTWEQKTITIAGDTTGTWTTDNTTGIRLWISLGSGSTYTGTAGAWNAGATYAATGQVNLIGTNGATFYVTGVQLERGSNATSFEFRDYGRELIMCQRYYEQINGSGNYTSLVNGFLFTTSDFRAIYPFKVRKRAYPTATFSALNTFYAQGSCNTLPTAAVLISSTFDTAYLSFVVTGGTTAGLGVFMLDNASTATFIGMSSEL